jgi:hypothetical protein|nr:MAG TPA: hypothetical protein [Caudoviricetes sp.]
MEFIYDCLVVARTYYGAFYLKPVIQSAVGCISRETEGCIPKLDTAKGVRYREANETGMPAQLQVSEKSGKMVTC